MAWNLHVILVFILLFLTWPTEVKADDYWMPAAWAQAISCLCCYACIGVMIAFMFYFRSISETDAPPESAVVVMHGGQQSNPYLAGGGLPPQYGASWQPQYGAMPTPAFGVNPPSQFGASPPLQFRPNSPPQFRPNSPPQFGGSPA